jgi:hypothetical protein
VDNLARREASASYPHKKMALLFGRAICLKIASLLRVARGIHARK